jgi:hypothetical protein
MRAEEDSVFLCKAVRVLRAGRDCDDWCNPAENDLFKRTQGVNQGAAYGVFAPFREVDPLAKRG